eukprot:4071441-Heterocapsa_arctica.AAC.1
MTSLPKSWTRSQADALVPPAPLGNPQLPWRYHPGTSKAVMVIPGVPRSTGQRYRARPDVVVSQRRQDPSGVAWAALEAHTPP